MHRFMTCSAIIFGLLASISMQANAAPVTTTASGIDAAAIQTAVDQFRAGLGEPNNGNTPSPQPGGRREIGWDGGGADAPAAIFANPMTTFSARGNVNTSPGGSLEISGQPTPEFGEINATYPDIFTTFSAPRLFAPLGSNVTDVLFTVPGTTDVQAVTIGFGAVFTDVDLADTTRIQFFDVNDASLGTFVAPTFDGGLSFLGVIFDAVVVARARITTGNSALGPNDTAETDVVAMDDFIYGEPQEVAQVSEPGMLAILSFSALALVAARRRKTKG